MNDTKLFKKHTKERLQGQLNEPEMNLYQFQQALKERDESVMPKIADISQMAKYIARDLKTLGYVPPTANHNNKVRLTSEEIKFIAEESGIEAYKIYMKFGW